MAPPSYRRHRFPPEIIQHAIWLYLRFTLSYRDVEELLAERGFHRSLPPGRYACELIKEDSGQWRFSRRTVFHDHDYTLDGIGR